MIASRRARHRRVFVEEFAFSAAAACSVVLCTMGILSLRADDPRVCDAQEIVEPPEPPEPPAPPARPAPAELEPDDLEHARRLVESIEARIRRCHALPAMCESR